MAPSRAVQISVYMPPELYDALENLARLEHRSTSNMATVLLKDAVLAARTARRRRRAS